MSSFENGTLEVNESLEQMKQNILKIIASSDVGIDFLFFS